MKICILGGTGFVGRSLISALSKENYTITVITRDFDKNKDLAIYPNLKLIQEDVYNEKRMLEVSKSHDVLINLIGILNEKGFRGKGFYLAHSKIARIILNVCKQNRIKRILHMSALNADPGGSSHYLRTKGEAESFLHTYGERFADVTSFRPSVIFGTEDSFINRFSDLLKFIPFVFPLACAQTRFAPVYVGDLVNFMKDSIDDVSSFNKKIDICGPKIYTLEEIVKIVIDVKGYSTRVIPLNNALSKFQAVMMEFLPGKPFSIDNFNSCLVDSISESGLKFKTELESVIKQYL
ncbi:MAG: complex I NDUFA9 subunit family protein [Thiotrichaceae bacterium]|nr:epimerase [Gammaproteobacteria bacterium]GIR92435.1 MAG: complex I NDUFA9 subunit family protein [Thiotrichaceae bacterium]